MKKSLVSIFPILLALALAAGCSKVPSANADNADNGDSSSSAVLPNNSAGPGEPAAAVQMVPAGTPLTVLLQSGVSSASAQSGDTFDAVLDEPVMVKGETMIPKGAEVTGRVVAANQGGRLHKPAFLRITLVSVRLNGKSKAL